MKKLIALVCLIFMGFQAFSQFENFSKKSDLESFKDTKLLVVLYPDSAYTYSIGAAIERYWTFTAFEFIEDTATQRYRKGNYAFLVFSKSKGSKNKTRIASSEEDFNGLAIIRKYSRRIIPENLLAYAYCNNSIDTGDWATEMTRAVQLLNNYFNNAVQVQSNGDLNPKKMMKEYPGDKSVMLDKKLLIESKQLEINGKEDAVTLFDGDLEEVEIGEIQKAIKWQDENFLYYYYSKDEKNCNKLVVNAQNSELMYFDRDDPNKCKCNAKDLKALKEIKDKASKGRK